MARLELEFVDFKYMEEMVSVNGKFVRTKNIKPRTSSCSIETKETSCDIVIYKGHKYLSKNWFWWNLLYFLISIFGIFDTHQNKKCLVEDARFSVSTEKDTRVVITKQPFADGEKLVAIETDSAVEEISNIQYYDKEALKRQSKMKKFKVFATIFSVVVIIALIVLL